MAEIYGVTVLPEEVDEQWLTALWKDGTCSDYAFAEVQCYNTLVWGIAMEEGWKWTHNHLEFGLKPPAVESLWEARFFGPKRELLFWRGAKGLQARLAVATAKEVDEERLPISSVAKFLGEPSAAGKNPLFAERITGGGNRVFVPQGCGIALMQHLSECPETGALRIALTRYTGIQK